MRTATLEELQAVGLVGTNPQLHLTDKGREWLRVLNEAEHQEISELGEAADLILSTNGIFR
jgi:hypothetical protein